MGDSQVPRLMMCTLPLVMLSRRCRNARARSKWRAQSLADAIGTSGTDMLVLCLIRCAELTIRRRGRPAQCPSPRGVFAGAGQIGDSSSPPESREGLSSGSRLRRTRLTSLGSPPALSLLGRRGSVDDRVVPELSRSSLCARDLPPRLFAGDSLQARAHPHLRARLCRGTLGPTSRGASPWRRS